MSSAASSPADPLPCVRLAQTGVLCQLLQDRNNYMSKKDFLRDASRDVSCAGKSLVEMMEDRLDEVFSRLKTEPAEDGRDPGRAEGIATCIAIIRNPYSPNINIIRAEAVERWEAATTEPELDDEEDDEEAEDVDA